MIRKNDCYIEEISIYANVFERILNALEYKRIRGKLYSSRRMGKSWKAKIMIYVFCGTKIDAFFNEVFDADQACFFT